MRAKLHILKYIKGIVSIPIPNPVYPYFEVVLETGKILGELKSLELQRQLFFYGANRANLVGVEEFTYIK